jgi:8-oxo-dGTP pyrophosphatase MutT (NUDIX family)
MSRGGEHRVPAAIVAIVDVRVSAALALKRFDDDREYPGRWCFAGGKVKQGESIAEAVRREVFEETGYLVGELDHIGQIESTSETHNVYEIECFVTTDWTGSPIDYPSCEHVAAVWTPFDLPPAGRTLGYAACCWVRR